MWWIQPIEGIILEDIARLLYFENIINDTECKNFDGLLYCYVNTYTFFSVS